ncbi:hypothetical protein [Salipiger sp.]|uniref:hypothetical protein n=1 Tax=Salipiger sp. TaxID=2078585 RepID=UPI003A985CFE
MTLLDPDQTLLSHLLEGDGNNSTQTGVFLTCGVVIVSLSMVQRCQTPTEAARGVA